MKTKFGIAKDEEEAFDMLTLYESFDKAIEAIEAMIISGYHIFRITVEEV